MVNPTKTPAVWRRMLPLPWLWSAGQKLPFDVTWPDAARAQRHRCHGDHGEVSAQEKDPTGDSIIKNWRVTLTFCWRWGLKPKNMTSGQLICFCFAKRTFSKNTWCFSRQTLEFDEQEMCFNDQTWWGSYMVLPCLANQASVGALEDV